VVQWTGGHASRAMGVVGRYKAVVPSTARRPRGGKARTRTLTVAYTARSVHGRVYRSQALHTGHAMGASW
jgi:hypothetical protein